MIGIQVWRQINITIVFSCHFMNLAIFEESIPCTIHHDNKFGKYGEAQVEDIDIGHRMHMKEEEDPSKILLIQQTEKRSERQETVLATHACPSVRCAFLRYQRPTRPRGQRCVLMLSPRRSFLLTLLPPRPSFFLVQ